MEEELAWLTDIYTYVITFFVEKGFQLIGALFITLLGMFVARRASRYIENLMLAHELDITLSRFSSRLIYIGIVATVIFVALKKVGIEITPIIAAIGALSLGAGLALQGTLSNYGAGIAIILSRPFVVGDTITVQGVSGLVREVKLSCTILSNEDEVRITIPNKHIIGEIIHNSMADSVIEGSIDIAYSSDTELAVSVISKACSSIEGVSKEREPQVGIEKFADSGISIGYRFWVPTDRLFELRYKVNSAVFAALKQQGIAIPFPQREVRLLQESQG